MRYLLIFFTFVLSSVAVHAANGDMMCAQVIQHATSPSGECKAFPTPCDVPADWKTVDSCEKAPTKDLIVSGVNLGQCKSYYDGCNNCTVGADGQSACTMRACFRQDTPRCLDEVPPKKDLIVSGVNLGQCTKYNDGCNTCSVNAKGESVCTKMFCEKKEAPKCLDTGVDNSLVVEEQEAQKNLDKVVFEAKKFASCSEMQKTVSDILWSTRANSYGGYYRGGIMVDDMAAAESVAPTAGAPSGNAAKSDRDGGASVSSETNTRIGGVDESEIVKNDGKYIYFYNERARTVQIMRAFPADSMSLVKEIKIPQGWYGVEIFVGENKLVITATKSGYSTNSKVDSRIAMPYYYNRDVRTIAAVYDISSLPTVKLERYYQVEGSLRTARRIDGKLYLLSASDASIPYNVAYDSRGSEVSKDVALRGASTLRMIPRRTNVAVSAATGKYTTSVASVASCSDTTYVLPNEETLKSGNFSPSFVTLSAIDLKNPSIKPQTSLLFGDASEILMTKDSLFITSHLTTDSGYSCPVGAMCIMPYYASTQNTLVHKFSIDGLKLTYKASALVGGSPINHYAMDEDTNGNFRIVTRDYTDEGSATNLFILDKNLKSIGSLTGIAPKENFQSARFIGDVLYLVTFEQIDPLFVVDLKNPKAPKIVGEMKMPGYSTYLHPYDANHLIGLGYNTEDNGYGGYRNGGLQIALYEINWNEKETAESKCGSLKTIKDRYESCLKDVDPTRIRVSKVSDLFLGDHGSYSDALQDPRLFVWYAQKNTLLLPATLMTSAQDKSNPYRSKDAWQGVVSVGIDTKSGVRELGRVTHLEVTGLEEKRNKECSQYTNVEKPVCRKLLNGQEYCPPVSTYVPEYCYADATLGEYFASQMWNFSDGFILRALYSDNILYTLSPKRLQASDIATLKPVSSITLPVVDQSQNYYGENVKPMMVR